MFLIDGVNYITAGLVQYTDANGSPFSNCSVDVYYNDEKESTFTTDSNGYGTASIVTGKSYTFRFKNSAGKIAYVLSPVMLGAFASGGDVEAETARATAAESALDTRLTTAEGDIDTLENGLSAETEARESADSTLQTNIDNEATARENADNALDARLDGAESDIDSLESSVDALYNTEVQGTDGETSVSSSTSGKVKTFVVGLASAIKTKIEAAYSHISDAVKHITATERTNWNTAYNHSQTEGNPHGTTIEEIDGLRTELTTIESDVSAIEGVIPSEATTSNQLADKSFVNSSIASQTAYFRGTFDIVTDLGLTHGASNTAIANALASVVSVVTPNDYTFVIDQDADGNTLYKRFKYSGSVWQYEYTLNNSSFTAAQWAAIQSGITAEDVADIGYNTTARHTHSNKNLLDTYTQSNASLADAVAKKHEHANKTILDNTTASYTTEDKTALDGKFDGFELQSDGFADTTKIGLGSASGTKILAQQAIMLWNYIKGKANAVYAAISHTHSIANVIDLQDNLNHKALALNLSRSETAYIRSILVLCKAYESATGSYFSGSITFRRSNGLNDPKYAIAALNAKYNTGARGALLSTVNYNSNSDMTTGVGIRLVEFTYNEIKYAGIECHEGAKWGKVNIIGYWNDFTPFIVDWYNTNTHTVLNQEIADSIHFITERYDFRLTSHSVITNLASTAAATFDGSANITPGVTGILPITKGGTGNTDGKATDSDKLGGQLPSYYATKSEIPDVSGKENTSNKVTTLDNSTTHYPSTSAVTTALSGKQDTISDIATIRSNAENGQTAYEWGDHANAGYLTDADLSGYLSTKNLYNSSAIYGVKFATTTVTSATATSYATYLFSRLQIGASIGSLSGNADRPLSGFVQIFQRTNSSAVTTTTTARITVFQPDYTGNIRVYYKIDGQNVDWYIATTTTRQYCSWKITEVNAFGTVNTLNLVALTSLDGLTEINASYKTPLVDASSTGIGSSTKPVYVDESGKVIECSREIPDMQGYHKDYSYCKRIVLNVPANNGVIIRFDAPSSSQRLVQFFIRYGKASAAVELNVGMIVSTTAVTSCIASILANGGLTSTNYPTDVRYDFQSGVANLFFRDSNASNSKVVEIVAMSNADVDYTTIPYAGTTDWSKVSLRAFPHIDLDTLLSGGGIGSTTQPVYVDGTGAVQPCSGNATLFSQLSGGNRTLTEAELESCDSVYSSTTDTTTRFINIDASLMVDRKKYYFLLGNNTNIRFKGNSTYDVYYHASKLTLTTSYQEIPTYGNLGFRALTIFKSGYNVYLVGY